MATRAAAALLLVYNGVGLANLPAVRAWLPAAVAGAPDDFLVTLLALSAFAVCAHAADAGWRAAAARLAAVAVLVTAAETLSLRTGVPFGRYSFHPRSAFGAPLPGGMPPLVPLGWLCSIGTSAAVARAAGARGRAAAATLTAALAAGTNAASDPVMSAAPGHRAWRCDTRAEALALGQPAAWSWELAPGEASFEGVPLTNFAAWFAVSWACVWLSWRAPASRGPPGAAVHLAVWAHLSTGIFYAAHPVHSPAVRVVGALLVAAPAAAAWWRLLRARRSSSCKRKTS